MWAGVLKKLNALCDHVLLQLAYISVACTKKMFKCFQLQNYRLNKSI